MTEKEFNDYLAEVVNNDDRCKNCDFKHENKGCFFAYDCIKNNHSHLREDKGGCKTTKIIIEIKDNHYDWIKEHKGAINLKTTRHLYESVREGIPLDDFLKQRKEPIDESVVESYLKESKQ